MTEILKYPVGCKIRWCEEVYEVLENYHDKYGVVKIGNEVIRNFYFSYQGEEASVVSGV